MVLLLSATDDGVLTARTRAIIGGSVENPPASRSGGLSGQWIAPVYRPGAPAAARIRGGIVAARYAASDYEIVCVGDSKTVGTGTGTKRPERSWPGVLRALLGGVEGFITASPADEDDRWTAFNMDRVPSSADDGMSTVTPGSPSQVSFTYSEPHTGGSFYIACPSGGTVTVTVDGGTPQPITVASGSTLKVVTPTVTGGGAHTYSILSNSTISVRGFRPTFNGTRLRVTNAGRAQSAPSSWAAGTALWDGFRTVIPNPDAIFCNLGTNGQSAIPALYDQLVAVTPNTVVIAPGGIGGASDNLPMYQALWAQADRLGLPLIDFVSVIGNHTEASSRGLMADTVHENRKGHAWEAAAVAAFLSVPK